MTPDTVLGLRKFFATSPEFCMNLQTTYDLTAQGETMKAEIARMRAA